MESLLVPTDFSDSALHAAKYACVLGNQMHSKRIILYHAYQTVVPATDLPFYPARELEQFKQESLQSLEKWANHVTPFLSGIDLIIKTSDDTLSVAVNELCHKERAALVIMGITGKSQFENIIIGNNAIKVLESSEFPILLVPPQAPLGTVKNIIFTTDLENVHDTIPLQRLDILLHALNARLWVLNVAPPDKHPFRSSTELSELHQLLDNYKPVYHFTSNTDIVQGIINFAREKEDALIVLAPKKRGMFYHLFHQSITKALAYRVTTPIIALPPRAAVSL